LNGWRRLKVSMASPFLAVRFQVSSFYGFAVSMPAAFQWATPVSKFQKFKDFTDQSNYIRFYFDLQYFTILNIPKFAIYK